MGERVGRPGEHREYLPVTKFLRVGIQPIGIGAEPLVRFDLPDLRSLKDVAMRALPTVAGGTSLHVDRLAALDRSRVWSVRTWRGLQVHEPRGVSLDRLVID